MYILHFIMRATCPFPLTLLHLISYYVNNTENENFRCAIFIFLLVPDILLSAQCFQARSHCRENRILAF
jgi:hypothetical protein